MVDLYWNADRTIASQPGDWVDRMGVPRSVPSIQRLAVLKPDHIGDLLIAEAAIKKLRAYFPQAHMTLFCGRWNVALAKSLGVFDEVIGIDFFEEVSGLQQSPIVAEKARLAGIKALQASQDVMFDLAVDLRYDDDSRLILLNIDAEIYAGFGSPRDYPFLDIMVPKPSGLWQGSGSQTVVTLRRFTAGPVWSEAPSDGAIGLRIAPRRAFAELSLSIVGAAIPSKIGTAHDNRLLGVGLESIELYAEGVLDPVATWTPETLPLVLGAGWGDPEPWGVWSIASAALIKVPLNKVPGDSPVHIVLKGRGHVNIVNQSVSCLMSDLETSTSGQFAITYPTNHFEARLTTSVNADALLFCSQAFELGAGQYDCYVDLALSAHVEGGAVLHLSIVGASSRRIVTEREFLLSQSRASRDKPNTLAFGFQIGPGPESYYAEIRIAHPERAIGCRITSVTFRQIKSDDIVLPVAHMQEWGLMLVERIGRLFSDEYKKTGSSVCLTTSNARALQAIERMRAWKASGHVVVGVALGVNSDIRRWPRDYFVDLCTALSARLEVKIVFIGGPGDKSEADEAAREIGVDPAEHVLCGLTSVAELGAILGEIDLYVGNNTGTTHFAGAAGVRTIGVYAGTNHPREWGPVGERASWIYRAEPCSPCHLTDLAQCKHGHACMVDLSVADVLAVVEAELRLLIQKREPYQEPVDRTEHDGAGQNDHAGADARGFVAPNAPARELNGAIGPYGNGAGLVMGSVAGRSFAAEDEVAEAGIGGE